jgi:hypothetical protein
MDENRIAILQDNVEKAIEDILDKRKIKYISDTPEFVEGLLVGLEIAGIFGGDINEVYNNNSDGNGDRKLLQSPD